MELIFESPQTVFSGDNPEMVHMPDNSVWGFHVESGRLQGSNLPIAPGDVDWGAIALSDFGIVTKDKEISLMRLKNIPRVGIYGVWHQDEILDVDLEVITPERHRLAIWEGEIDISNYLESFNIEFRENTPIASASMTFQNPNQILSGEDTSLVRPGMKLEISLKMGDSEEYPISVQYVDRGDMGATRDSISVDARNASGKLLKDQSFDENNEFLFQTYYLNVVALLENAGITDYAVQDTGTFEYGIKLPENMSYLEGLEEMINASLNWKVVEDQDGKIIAGSTVTFLDIQRNSTYEFNRGTDVWSRNIVRDDKDVYSRVCGKFELTEIVGEEEIIGMQLIYKEVINGADWDVAPNKTLYIDFPKESDTVEVTAILEEIARRLTVAGIQEIFVGPIRPHLLPGDEAKITSDSGPKLIGLITNVKHSMGRNGFITEFTVDSSGQKGKPRINDYISEISKKATMGKGTRLY